MMFRKVGTLVLAMLAAGCASLWPPEQNAAALAALAPAARCHADLPFFGYYKYTRDEPMQYMEPDGRIAMGNDGGWCMIRYQLTMPNGGLSAGEMEVTQPPVGGTVMVGTLDRLLRIAYQPNPGFTGQDAFLVHIKGPIPYVVPIRVFVGQ